MKREISWGAVAVTLAAVIGISSQLGGKAGTAPGDSPTVGGKGPSIVPTTKSLFDQGPCVEIEEHLQDFLVNGNRESRVAPSSCYGLSTLPESIKASGEMLRKEAQGLHYVIATVPDPVHSHFSLSFDRFLEAIQQGASDEQYVYDSSWLPWESEETPYALIQDQDKADDRKKQREEQPGILLFRKNSAAAPTGISQPYREGLVIFVVGEEPTRGIHRAQFENAAAWIAALQPSTKSETSEFKLPGVGILGPTFSGSLPSLAELLEDIRSKPGNNAKKQSSGNPLRIYSGYIAGRNAVDWFTSVESGQPDIRFASFQQSDDALMNEYCSYLNYYHFDLRHLAIISEDETAYGSEGSKPDKSEGNKPDKNTDVGTIATSGCFVENQEKSLAPRKSPARFFYPRDISALRTAYQKQSIFGSQPSQPVAEGGRRTLSANIADPEGQQHDSIRSYNRDQTAESQEAVLQQIVSQLHAHQAEYILLRSSNPLDQLFLAHYFRLTYPQGRIVILGADLLLRRESGAARLSGIMTLTTYPLLPWEPHWTSSPSDLRLHSHRVFPQDGAEGIYVATRFLLHTWCIKVRRKVTVEALTAQMDAAGFTKVEASKSLPTGRYSISGNDLNVSPPNEKDPSRSPISIHIENGEVLWLKDAKGQTLSTYEFAPALDLPRDTHFLPTDPRLELPDYSTPFWIRNQNPAKYTVEPPPAWLSVLGRNDFWPLAAIDGNPLPQTIPQQGHFVSESLGSILKFANKAGSSLGRILTLQQGEAVSADDSIPSWTTMPLSSRIALFVLFVWAIFHGLCCCFPSITSKPNHRAYFVCTPKSFRSHRWLLTLCSLALSSTATVLAWSYGAMSSEGIPLQRPRVCLVSLLLLWVMGGMSLVVNIWRQSDVRPVSKKGITRPTVVHAIPQTTAPVNNEPDEKPVSQQGPPWTVRCGRCLAHNWPFLWPPLTYVIGTLGFYCWLYFSTEWVMIPANRIPVYWRGMNLTSGVSPVVPIIALTVGAYMWFWHSLQGLAFFGPDVPLLPSNESLALPGELDPKSVRLRMFGRNDAAKPVVAQCWPFASAMLRAGIVILGSMILMARFFSIDGETPIRSLGAPSYAQFICLFIGVSVSVMLANAWQLLQVWIRLRRLLIHLDRLPLRRSMAAFPGVSWGSVWKISGNVLDMRYKLLVSQLECITHLQNSLVATRMMKCGFGDGPRSYKKVEDALAILRDSRARISKWYARICDKTDARNQGELKNLQKSLADFAGILVAWMLVPAWQMEDEELSPAGTTKADDTKEQKQPVEAAHLAPHIRHAERLVCYVYLGFIQNTLGRMRTLVMGILWLFISATISMASYPFDPRPVVNGAMVLLFLILGAVIVFVYAQMHRDPILSLVTNTNPGELDGDFWVKLVSFGAGPMLGLMATIFPELTDFLFSWVAPGISSLK